MQLMASCYFEIKFDTRKMDPEKCLDKLGGDNKWILKWFFLISYLKSLPCVFSMYSFQFTAVIPENYHCKIPQNASLNEMIPKELIDGVWKYSSCKQYKNFTNSSIIPCQNGYNYSMQYFTTSIVTEWDLVCDKAMLRALATSSFFLISFLGAIVSCSLSDFYGRKKVLIASFICLNVCEFIQAFITSVSVLIIFKLLAGIFQQGCFISGFTITIEFFSKKNRSNACLVDAFSWTFASVILILYVYFIRDWRSYFLWTSVTMLPFCLLFYHMPESIRWLLTKGRIEDGVKLLKIAAKFSNPPLQKDVFDNIKEFQVDFQENPPIYNITNIIKDKLLLRYQLINFFVWMTTAMTYYGLQTKVVEIGNPFINFFLAAIVEVPANILCFPISNKYGRKSTIGFTNFLVAFCLMFGYIFLKSLKSVWPAIVIFLIGKMLNTGIFNLIFMHVSEFFPTTLRTTAVGLSSSFARIGAALGAVIFQISFPHDSFAFIIVTFCCLVSGVIVFCLPETLGKKMPSTIEEIKEWVSQKRFITLH